MLDAEKLTKACQTIPPQVGESECHINSAARALVLLGINIDHQDYYHFMNGFKQIMINRYGISTKSVKLVLVLSLLGLTFRFLSNVQETASLQKAASSIMVSGAGVSFAVLIFTVLNKMYRPLGIGSDPWDVANYINKYLPIACADASMHGYNIFSICVKQIDKAICIQKRPVIAIFFYEAKRWHYVNIVGVKKEGSNHISKFAILDTNQECYSLTYDDMEYFMYNLYKNVTETARWKNPKKNYYIIGFAQSNAR